MSLPGASAALKFSAKGLSGFHPIDLEQAIIDCLEIVWSLNIPAKSLSLSVVSQLLA